MLILRGSELVVRPAFVFAVVLVLVAIPFGALLLIWGARWSTLGVIIVVTFLTCLACLKDRNDDVGTGPGLPMQQQPAPDHGLGASVIAGLGLAFPMQQQRGPDQGLGASTIAGLGPGHPMQQQPAPDRGLGASVIAGLPTYAYEKACGGGDECAVCLGEVQRGEVVKQLPACTHLFHEGCIDAWLRAHVTCPVCRSPVDAALPAATEAVV